MDAAKSAPDDLALISPSRYRRQAWLFTKAMQQLRRGQLAVRFPDGRETLFGDPGETSPARMHIRSPRFFRRVIQSGSTGMGESYMAGEWETEDLTAVLQVLAGNQGDLGRLARGMHALSKLGNRLLHLNRRNHLGNTKRNIAEHYDLSNAFYQTFLDDTLSYSAALFDEDHPDLESAQRNKIRRVLDRSSIQPGQTLLEIGSGWGALAVQAAREYDCHVVTITLSEEQFALTRTRVAEAGLEDRIDVRLMDYRHLELQVDAVVSIEMIEAVGHEFLPTYFQTIDRSLKPGGHAVLQAITIPDERYAHYCRSSDFIRKHIFPGGHLPSPGALRDVVSTIRGLNLVSMTGFGRDYARTLADWHHRFRAATEQVEALGFDAEFRRKWAFYLSYCEAGFAEDLIDVQHVVLQKSGPPA